MRLARALAVTAVAVCAALPALAQPADLAIRSVEPQLDRLQKWNDSNGDTADPFWADDGQLYHFTCDGRGFGKERRNFCFNKLTGTSWATLRGELVNAMDYGKADETLADGATWKVCGQTCIDGRFYAFVARNRYGHKSGDPLMRQTSFNSSLIRSDDRGRTWSRSPGENLAQPMWPGSRFGGPSFIHYGQNGGAVERDGADRYVYAVSNNGFWNGGDDMILGRVLRSDLPKLDATLWSYHAGGDGMDDKSWVADPEKARPILAMPGKLGWTSPAFLPALNRYLLVAWYVTPKLKKWFEPKRVVYEFFEAPHPWGPWSYVSEFDDRFLGGEHMYGPNVCAKFQEARGDGVEVSLFTSGCPFEDKPKGLYKMWRIPLLVSTRPTPRAVTVNDNHPAIAYSGSWQSGEKPGPNWVDDDVHWSEAEGAAAEFAFEGTGVRWLSEKRENSGRAEVFVDGVSRGEIDLAQPDFERLTRVPVFAARGLKPGRHVLRVVARSVGAVVVDAFEVIPGTEAETR
jgi:hypothetical protein